ncbi:class I SAM-dependent methyltransferase [Neorhizobium tomejilense]|uniref:class I SAM-dependent methyltransferase n=1 Tax=Neorhizobium tomejilense TaxID=2093828 RepID=UPI000CF9C8AE|nr:class I SAM-dependent methyltransferase [Neorhizobium tomejilense]
MTLENGEHLNDVANYYSDKLRAHGNRAAGVDWNGEEGQNLRFSQLLKVVDPTAPYTIGDIGCGYGALIDYLRTLNHDFQYTGIDISEQMVSAANARFENQQSFRFLVGNSLAEPSDYCVASGIFNVRLERSDEDWLSSIIQTIEKMNASSRKGFAFNCLTSYSDSEKKRSYLYYADPLRLFDICKRRFSRNVALLHDYGLYEFTIIVRKDL